MDAQRALMSGHGFALARACNAGLIQMSVVAHHVAVEKVASQPVQIKCPAQSQECQEPSKGNESEQMLFSARRERNFKGDAFRLELPETDTCDRLVLQAGLLRLACQHGRRGRCT